jgi:hypothetical protein
MTRRGLNYGTQSSSRRLATDTPTYAPQLADCIAARYQTAFIGFPSRECGDHLDTYAICDFGCFRPRRSTTVSTFALVAKLLTIPT